MLGRPVVDVGEREFADYVVGATALVTGAGGSVGARLCARLSRLGVGELILVDQAEASLVELTAALCEDGFTDAVPVLADIRNARRVADVFERFRPRVVYHAAAYKQVPLVEAHPVEGVATNVLGTKRLVDAAHRFGVERFVLFSTDKAVAPTSILGQTKAVAEWIVAAAGGETRATRSASVRLGNVVDSAGSILPVFRRQVARGGPVCVTHPEMTRYLMTASEAAGLAIVAGALADSQGVYWLDIGPPVRILELAQRLARAASVDIAVDFIGLRAGERLHEHPFWSTDDVVATPCEPVVRSTMHRVDSDWLDAWIAVLARHVGRASAAGVRAALAEMGRASARHVALPSAALAR